jgi:alpha-glucosidase
MRVHDIWLHEQLHLLALNGCCAGNMKMNNFFRRLQQIGELTLLISWLLLFAATGRAGQALVLASPSGATRAEILVSDLGALSYAVSFQGHPVVEPSPLGITFEGVNFGTDLRVDSVTRAEVTDIFPVMGGFSTATQRAGEVKVALIHRASGQRMRLEARAYEDGFAYRYVMERVEGGLVAGEQSSWRLPAGSRVWFFERASGHKLKTYAGEWMATDLARLPTISAQGPVQGAPLVLQLPDATGYAVITEAVLANYSGMRLRAVGENTLVADLADDNGFRVDGPVISPWRVTLLSRDLDGLVNNSVVLGLNPSADPRLFADTSYIKPGRSVWRWFQAGTGTPPEERQFVDYARALGFEYTLIDNGWQEWPDAWRELRELTSYARGQGVGVWVWKHFRDVQNPAGDWADLRGFLDALTTAGVAGVKMDFMNSEQKARIDFDFAVLRLAAERRLMVDFHGVHKPSGEMRTFPNELTREAIRGLEINRMSDLKPENLEPLIPATHNAALPFTRLLLGPGDYTPFSLVRPGPTTWAHQLATVVQFTSPLQVIAEHPEKLLSDPAMKPALDVFQAIPSTWDETRVLAPSEIGALSVFARRKAADWFIAALTGAGRVEESLPLDLSFLGTGRFRATVIASAGAKGFSREEVADIGASSTLAARLGAADGWVAWVRPMQAAENPAAVMHRDETMGWRTSGEWFFADGVARATQNDETFRQNKNHGPAIWRDQPFDDATIEFRYKAHGTQTFVVTVNDRAGHVFRVHTGEKITDVRGFSPDIKKAQRLAFDGPPLKADEWTRVRIEFTGPRAVVYVGGAYRREVEMAGLDRLKTSLGLSFTYGSVEIKDFSFSASRRLPDPAGAP